MAAERALRRWLYGLLGLLSLFMAEGIEGQTPDPVSEGRPTEGAPFLLLPAGARSVALAGAVVALRHTEAVYWNPGGLAGLRGSRLVLTRGEQVTGDALGLSLQHGLSGGLVLGVTFHLLDEGTQDATDGQGNIIGSLTNRNHLAMLSAGLPLGESWGVGVNLKTLWFELGCRGQCPDGRVRSSSQALDVGLRGRPLASLPVELGASLLHMGKDFNNEATGEGGPLPTRLRVGVGWSAWAGEFEGEQLQLKVSMDLEERVRDPSAPGILVGAEFTAGTEDRLYLRAGYAPRTLSGLEGAAAGVGLRYDRFEVDLARSLPRGVIASQQEPIHLTLALRF